MQDVTLSDGQPMWHHVAKLVAEWGEDLVGEHGLSSVGAVIGATHPRAVGEARKLMPQTVILLPGVGAQGAKPADLARAFTSGPASALVNASRSVIFAYREAGGDFRAAAGAEAARIKQEVWAVSSAGRLMAPRTWRTFVAPTAFLLVATIVVLIVHGSLHGGHTPTTPTVTS